MRNRILALLLTLAMIMTLIPATVAASPSDSKSADRAETTTVETVTEPETPVNGAENNDELFNQYVMRAFYGDYGIAGIANHGTEHLNEKESTAYTYLKSIIEAIAAGNHPETNNITLPTDFTIPLGDLTLGDASSGLSDAQKKTIGEELSKKFNLSNIIDYLLADCPYDLYWFDKTKGVSTGYSISRIDKGNGIHTIEIKNFVLDFTVAQDYRDGSQYKVKEEVAAITTAVQNANDIVEKYKDKTDYEKLKGYLNEICNLVEYNDNAAKTQNYPYGDPWQLIYVFDNDTDTKVVCEGYSKAFQYLCDKTEFSGDVQCYTVSGTMGGGTGAGRHMWNIVSIGGKNYLVDVTNCDGESLTTSHTVGFPDKLFLAGTGSGEYSRKYEFTDPVITYTYDDNMVNLWGEKALTLASKKYSPEKSITVTVKNRTYNGQAATAAQADETADINYTLENFEAGDKATVTWKKVGESSIIDAPKDVGTYEVIVSCGDISSEPYEFTIAPADYTYTYNGTADTKSKVGSKMPGTEEGLTATGVNGESVPGTVTWFTDSTCQTPADGTFDSIGTVTLYWKFTPDDTCTNYISDPKTGSQEFTVEEKTIKSFTVEGVQTEYVAFDNFNPENIILKVTYEDGTPGTITPSLSEIIVKDGNNLTVGKPTVTIIYKNVEGFVSINVSPKSVDISKVKWSGETSYTFDGQVKSLTLDNIPETGVKVETSSGMSATYVGDYTATATLIPADDNYTLEGNTTITQGWKITSVIQDPSVENPTVKVGGNKVNLKEKVTGILGGCNITFTLPSEHLDATLDNGVLTTGLETGSIKVTFVIEEKNVDNEGAAEYTAYTTGEITITVVAKDIDKTSVVVTQDNITYGNQPDPQYTTVSGSISGLKITYNGNTEVPKDVGDYKVLVTFETAETIYEATTEFKIEPATIDVTGGTAANKTYDGSNSATITGVEFTELQYNEPKSSITYTVTSATFDSADSGSRTVTFSVELNNSVKNYKLGKNSGTAKATIDPKQIDVTIQDIPDQVYTGNEQKPALTVTYLENGKQVPLTVNKDYTAEYSGNKDVGDASVTVKQVAVGNYTFADTPAKFKITPKQTPGTIQKEYTRSHLYSLKTQQEISFEDLPADCGSVTISVGEISGDKSIFSVPPGPNGDSGITYTLAGQAAFTAGQTATIPVTVRMQNYSPEITISIKVTLVNKDTKDLTVTISNVPYGTDPKPVYNNDGIIGDPVITYTPDSKNVGSYKVTVWYETEECYYEGTADFSIYAKTITPSVTVKNKDYDESNTAEATVAFSGTVNGESLKAGQDYTINATFDTSEHGEGKTVTYTINLKPDGPVAKNYVLASGTGTGNTTATINRKDLENGVQIGTIGNVVYNGKSQEPEIALTVPEGVELVEGKDYEVSYTNNKNVGTATVTVTSIESSNYAFTSATKTFEITKATLDAIDPVKVEYRYSDTGTKTIDLVGIPSDAEPQKFTLGTIAEEDKALLNMTEGKAVSVNSTTGAVTLTLADGITYVEDTKIEIPVMVEMTNYKDVTVIVEVSLTDKQYQAALTYTGAETMTFGQTLNLTATGGSVDGAAITWTIVEGGTGTADIAGSTLTPTRAGTVMVKGTKAGDETYISVETEVITITIGKAKPTGAPTCGSVSSSGKTLADVTIGVGSIKPEGTIKWDDPSTSVERNKAYGWTFTPTDAVNYTTLTGTLTPWVYTPSPAPSYDDDDSSYTPPSSSSGSDSGSSTSKDDVVTDTKPQEGTGTGTGSGSSTGSGSNAATTTETTATPSVTTKGDITSSEVSSSMGDKIVDQAQKNKSDTVVVAPEVKKETSKTEVTLPGKTVKDLANKTNSDVRVETPAANITIPNKALSDLGGNQKVTVSTEKTDTGVAVEVKVGNSTVDSISGGVKAEIPHEDCGPTTVAVVVHDDGTREVIRTSLADATAGTVTARVDGTAKIEIIDNAKDFNDVSSRAWYSTDVAFAASHELMKGTADGIFEPTTDITRASMAMLLYNAEHNPNAGIPAFTDTASGKWYTDAVSWASENGVVNGKGDGTFAPDDNITREQMAVILYNYAKFKGVDTGERGSLTRFPDASSVSGWATTAMRWAVSAGLFSGDGEGRLNPAGNASRAEVAALLQRFCRALSE